MTSPTNPHIDRPPAHDISRGEPSPGRETTDVNIRAIVWLAGGTIAGVGVVIIVLWYLLTEYQLTATRNDPEISPLVQEKVAPPPPRLQRTPNRDYQEYRAAEEGRLASYDWVDRQQGVVSIPITRAIDLIIERGLPKTEATEPQQDASEAGSPQLERTQPRTRDEIGPQQR